MRRYFYPLLIIGILFAVACAPSTNSEPVADQTQADVVDAGSPRESEAVAETSPTDPPPSPTAVPTEAPTDVPTEVVVEEPTVAEVAAVESEAEEIVEEVTEEVTEEEVVEVEDDAADLVTVDEPFYGRTAEGAFYKGFASAELKVIDYSDFL